MSNFNVQNENWLEIAFENRNKAYGAYQLRKESDATTIKAMLLTFGFIAFGIGLFYLISTKTKNLPLMVLFLVYFLVFVFATPAQHMSVRLILIPLIFTSIYFYHKENKII
mgnify:CR=1 FL=1